MAVTLAALERLMVHEDDAAWRRAVRAGRKQPRSASAGGSQERSVAEAGGGWLRQSRGMRGSPRACRENQVPFGGQKLAYRVDSHAAKDPEIIGLRRWFPRCG